jgi:hypothetical protein
MTTRPEIIQQAIEGVEAERSLLSTEQCRFRTLRAAISRVTVDEKDASSAAALLETYRETVLMIPDFETTYEEPLEENLKKELSPSSAEVLLSNAPLTQKRKRDLLMETNMAIEQRNQVLTQLSQEQESLERLSDKLVDICTAIEELPECAPERDPLEEVLDAWEAYDVLQQRCEALLEERQQHIHQIAQENQNDEDHTLNEYLYHELGTPYPVLSAIARTCEIIRSRRGSSPSDPTSSVR